MIGSDQHWSTTPYNNLVGRLLSHLLPRSAPGRARLLRPCPQRPSHGPAEPRNELGLTPEVGRLAEVLNVDPAELLRADGHQPGCKMMAAGWCATSAATSFCGYLHVRVAADSRLP